MINNIEKVIRENCNIDNFDVSSLLSNIEYRIYLGIPKRICKYLNHFHVNHQPKDVKKVLGLFYICLKAVDDDIDEYKETGSLFLDRFNSNTTSKDSKEDVSPSIVLTDVLKKLTSQYHTQVLDSLTGLCEAVSSEKEANSMVELIERRKNTGKCTALTTIQIMSPYAERNTSFEKFLVELGEFGILVDTVLDLKNDLLNKELKFRPDYKERALLYGGVFKDAIKIISSYPFLVQEFFKAGITVAGCFYKKAKYSPTKAS